MKDILPLKGMPILQLEPCSQNPNKPARHCWHSQRGAVHADKLQCCHCASVTTKVKRFNPCRVHGRFGFRQQVQPA